MTGETAPDVLKSCLKRSTGCVKMLSWAYTAPCLKNQTTHTEAEEGSRYLGDPKPPTSRGASIRGLADGVAGKNSVGGLRIAGFYAKRFGLFLAAGGKSATVR